MDSAFNARVRAMDNRFDRYTKQMDEDFASYLAKSWERFSLLDVEKDRFDDKSNFINISYSSPVKYPRYSPVKGAKYMDMKIPFFEKGVVLDVDADTQFSLLSTSEMQVSKAWRRLMATSFSTIIEECDKLRSELKLNDWGILLFVSRLSDQVFKKDQTNEKKIFMAFILAHAGYDVKLGRAGKGTGRNAELHLLVPFKTKVDEWKTTIDGKKYYIWSDIKDKNINKIYSETDNLYSYRKNFKLAKADLDLAVREVPLLGSRVLQKTIESKSPNLQNVKIAWKNTLTEYYDTYPNTILSVYLNTPLSTETKGTLQSSLQPMLNNETKSKAVEIFLFWFYHAFQYRLDVMERTFFSEQTVKSQYSDCEDRAIFLARIVKEIVGLNVVLIAFEGDGNKIGHVVTGIEFGGDIGGESKRYKGRIYTICDPSDKRCIIGTMIEGYDKSKYEIIELIN